MSPSAYTPYIEVNALCDFIKKQGFVPVVSSATAYDTSSPTYLAASDKVRVKDLQTAIENTSFKAIWCARGGYGMSRIIDLIDLSCLKNNPKWIIGFSDITLLHLHLHTLLGLVSIHGPMAEYIKYHLSSPDVQSTVDLLEGKQEKVSIQVATPEGVTHYGKTIGEVLGGNLSLIMNAIGTRSEPSWDGSILVIEDVGEYLYAIERNLIELKRHGVFDKIGGLVIGTFEGLKDTTPPLGENVVSMIERLFGGVRIPLAINMPIGHGKRNVPFLHGAVYSLEVNSTESRMEMVGAI